MVVQLLHAQGFPTAHLSNLRKMSNSVNKGENEPNKMISTILKYLPKCEFNSAATFYNAFG